MRSPRRHRLALAAVFAGTGLAVGACGSIAPYAAIVDGSRISANQLLRELDAIGSNKAFVTGYEQGVQQAAAQGQTTAQPDIFDQSAAGHRTFTQGFSALILNTDIRAQVIHEQVGRRHVPVTAAEITAARSAAAAEFGQDPTVFSKFNSWFQHVFQVRAAEEAALSHALPPVPSDAAAVQRFYDGHTRDFVVNECVSHILVGSQQQAAAIRARIEAGASFAAQARRYSSDKTSAVKGGDLGCNPPGSYVPPFEAVADTIAVGRISAPVQSRFGWHLILVTKRQLQPLDATTAGQIQQQLAQESPITALFDSVQASLKVEINPAYGSWDPTQGVIAPIAPPPNSGLPTTTVAPAAAPGLIPNTPAPAPQPTPTPTPTSTPTSGPTSTPPPAGGSTPPPSPTPTSTPSAAPTPTTAVNPAGTAPAGPAPTAPPPSTGP